MSICIICGHLASENNLECVFNTSKENAIWLNDYEAMNKEVLTHKEHQLVVARWAVHNSSDQSEKTMKLFSKLVKDNWGSSTKYISGELANT